MADIPASVILVTYTAPLSRIDELLAEHRAWLARQYQAGTFIAAGRQVPRTGSELPRPSNWPRPTRSPWPAPPPTR